MILRVPHLLVLTLLGTSLVGCAGPWASNYDPNPSYRGIKFSPTTDVQVRTIEYERFQKFAEREREMRIASTTAPQDLPPEEQLAERKRLLEALQIQQPADEVIVLGVSEFTETAQLDPYSKDLREFAQKIGADYVVVTSVYRGPVTTVVREPVTTYSRGWVTGTPGRRGRFRSLSYSDTSTTWVPMQITEDAWFYQAFFLRRTRPDEQPVP